MIVNKESALQLLQQMTVFKSTLENEKNLAKFTAKVYEIKNEYQFYRLLRQQFLIKSENRGKRRGFSIYTLLSSHISLHLFS